jgi:hypothetical protein
MCSINVIIFLIPVAKSFTHEWFTSKVAAHNHRGYERQQLVEEVVAFNQCFNFIVIFISTKLVNIRKCLLTQQRINIQQYYVTKISKQKKMVHMGKTCKVEFHIWLVIILKKYRNYKSCCPKLYCPKHGNSKRMQQQLHSSKYSYENSYKVCLRLLSSTYTAADS